MNTRKSHIHLGLTSLGLAGFLTVVAIPQWVSSPSNVGNIILSPLFWPYVLAGLTALIGLGLLATAFQHPVQGDKLNEDIEDRSAGMLRLAVMAVIMLAAIWAMPRIGMVWTSMAVFAATAFLVQTRHPKTALICAVILPLVLYAFFAHVAGVAVPQGNFVRLP